MATLCAVMAAVAACGGAIAPTKGVVVAMNVRSDSDPDLYGLGSDLVCAVRE